LRTRRGLVFAALLGAVSPILWAQQRPDPELEMQSYVRRFSGPQPMECGRHLLKRVEGSGYWIPAGEATLRQSVECGVAAASNRKGFWTFTQSPGIDSWVAQGLVGTPEGTVYRFSFDSAPCGGPDCAARISFERCAKPVAGVVAGRAPEFRCSDAHVKKALANKPL
jgi:hypothetical protein